MHFPVTKIFPQKNKFRKTKDKKFKFKSTNPQMVFESINPQNEQDVFIKISLRKTQNSNSKYLFIRNMPWQQQKTDQNT